MSVAHSRNSALTMVDTRAGRKGVSIHYAIQSTEYAADINPAPAKHTAVDMPSTANLLFTSIVSLDRQ